MEISELKTILVERLTERGATLGVDLFYTELLCSSYVNTLGNSKAYFVRKVNGKILPDLFEVTYDHIRGIVHYAVYNKTDYEQTQVL